LAGHEPTHWTQTGELGAAVDIVFQYARKNGCVLLSQDLDFTRMLALSGAHLPSVIQLRVESPLPARIGDQVLFVLKTFAEELAAGCLVSVDFQSNRLRLLPLRKAQKNSLPGEES
jgi:predicted nuclease of predicted toxin-antitoxin system